MAVGRGAQALELLELAEPAEVAAAVAPEEEEPAEEETAAVEAEPETVVVAGAEATEPVPVEEAREEVLGQALATALGTLTPWAEQSCCAKVTAWAWSAASQVPARQQATLLMKSLLEQMHLTSEPQPA